MKLTGTNMQTTFISEETQTIGLQHGDGDGYSNGDGYGDGYSNGDGYGNGDGDGVGY